VDSYFASHAVDIGTVPSGAMNLVEILVGAALLLLGRRLFWLFVAGVGFIVGSLLAATALSGQSELLIFLVALAVGLVGALIAVFLQHVVVAIAGGLAGGYLLHMLAGALNFEEWNWIAFLIGCLLGAIVVLAFFNWALILLSTLIGSTVVVQNLALDPALSVLLFVGLCVLGILVQARQVKPAPKTTPPSPTLD
jgi:MFS family permease